MIICNHMSSKVWDEITYRSQTLTVVNGWVISPILYNVCNYLSMLGFKLSHVRKGGPWHQPAWALADVGIIMQVGSCMTSSHASSSSPLSSFMTSRSEKGVALPRSDRSAVGGVLPRASEIPHSEGSVGRMLRPAWLRLYSDGGKSVSIGMGRASPAADTESPSSPAGK